MKKEMRNQAKQLERMKTLQRKEHKENLMLKSARRLIAQKKLEEKIKKGNARKNRILKKLLVKERSMKQELKQAQEHASSLQAELNETSAKIERSSQQIHSLQSTLQEKERANESLLQKLSAAKQARDQLRKWSTCLGCGGVVVLMLAILIPTILISLQVITPLMGMFMNAYKLIDQ